MGEHDTLLPYHLELLPLDAVVPIGIELVEQRLPQLGAGSLEFRLGLDSFIEVHELAQVQSLIFAAVILLEVVCGDSEEVKLTHVVDDLGLDWLLPES